MNELFKNTLMVCSAVSAFGGTGYIGVKAIDSYIDSRVAAVSASSGSGSEVASDSQVDGITATVKSLKKLLK